MAHKELGISIIKTNTKILTNIYVIDKADISHKSLVKPVVSLKPLFLRAHPHTAIILYVICKVFILLSLKPSQNMKWLNICMHVDCLFAPELFNLVKQQDVCVVTHRRLVCLLLLFYFPVIFQHGFYRNISSWTEQDLWEVLFWL